MAYVVKIINVDKTGGPSAHQHKQADELAQNLASKSRSAADRLADAKSSNMTEALNKAGPVQAVMERVGGKISKQFQTFKAGGMLATQLRSSGVGNATAAGLSAAAAGIVGTLDIANQIAGNIGTFTRNKTAQNRVNNVKAITGEIAGIGGKLLLGSAAGPVGLAFAAASIATDYSIRAYNLALEVEERTTQSARATERLGRIVSLRGRA